MSGVVLPHAAPAMVDGLDHMFDDRALGDAEPCRDFGVRQVMELDEHEDLSAFGRKLSDGVLQERDLLLRPDDGVERRAWVRLVEGLLRMVERDRSSVLLAAVMVDDEIRRDAKEKGARIGESFAGGALHQAEEGVLQEVFGRFRAAQPAREELLQVLPMFTDQG